jgi:hypothetical protein
MTTPTVDNSAIDAAFETFLAARPEYMTLRQQFWLAFAAGATYALDKMRDTIDTTYGPTQETPP